MGYGYNPDTVNLRRHLLTELEAGRTTTWVTAKSPQATRRRAYEIREALRIAARYPDRFPELAVAAENFSIHEVEDGLIEARFKSGKTETSAGGESAIHGLEPHGRPVPTVGLTLADHIIGSWKAHLPSNDPLHFTKTTLPNDELVKLYVWARAWTPKLMILVGEGLAKDTLTLSLHDSTVMEFAWSPPEKTQKYMEDFDFDK